MRSINQLMDLSGRRSLVTGAAGSLGKMFSHTLAELNSSLVLVDKPGTDLESLKIDIESIYGVDVEVGFFDLEREELRLSLSQLMFDSKKPLNILVNNAAFVGASDLIGWRDGFGQQSTDTWRRALEVNLTAIFELCRELSPLLRSSKSGSVVNITSIYGVFGPDWSLYKDTSMGNPAAYAASKGGVIQLTRWLATTLAPDIRVNAIAPGGIFRNQPDLFVERYSSRTPLGRMAKEEDIKGVLAYLATDLSSYVTGQTLSVDGGWGVW